MYLTVENKTKQSDNKRAPKPLSNVCFCVLVLCSFYDLLHLATLPKQVTLVNPYIVSPSQGLPRHLLYAAMNPRVLSLLGAQGEPTLPKC